jgi:hypothetical protein
MAALDHRRRDRYGGGDAWGLGHSTGLRWGVACGVIDRLIQRAVPNPPVQHGVLEIPELAAKPPQIVDLRCFRLDAKLGNFSIRQRRVIVESKMERAMTCGILEERPEPKVVRPTVLRSLEPISNRKTSWLCLGKTSR